MGRKERNADYRRRYSERAFWRKLSGLPRTAGMAAVERAVTLYVVLTDRDTPLWARALVIAALGYFIYPLDAVPDAVPLAGLADDVAMMGADPYDFRSGFNGGISFCEDTRPEAYPRALLRAAIAKGKRIRKYYFGNLYGLTEVTADPKDWCVLQYHRPAEEDGMVVAFRRHESPYTGFTCALHEIDAEREYGVTVSSDYTPAPATTMTGTELRTVVLNTNKAPDSLLLEYRLLPQ